MQQVNMKGCFVWVGKGENSSLVYVKKVRYDYVWHTISSHALKCSLVYSLTDEAYCGQFELTCDV